MVQTRSVHIDLHLSSDDDMIEHPRLIGFCIYTYYTRTRSYNIHPYIYTI